MAGDDRTATWRRDPAAIRADLEASREQIAESLVHLRTEIARQLDWRRPIRMKPLHAVGLAFALGYWLGRRRHPPAVPFR